MRNEYFYYEWQTKLEDLFSKDMKIKKLKLEDLSNKDMKIKKAKTKLILWNR